MRALVTGASGFVGRFLVEHLEDVGDEVTAVDSRSGVDVTDADSVHAILDANRPDVVYHLAALSHVGESWSAPAEVFRVNAGGTLTVLRAATDYEVARVVVVASADAYGAVDGVITEDTPLRPLTPYGASKAAADLLALQAHLGDGLATIRVRAFNHTGPGQQDRFLVPALARRIAEAEAADANEIRVGSLDAVRDLSDVRDVVAAYRLLAVEGTPGDAYNVCSGHGIRVAEVVERLLARSERPLRVIVDPELVRPVEVPRLVGDPTKLQRDTGWRPHHDLDSTLDAVLAEARARTGGRR